MKTTSALVLTFALFVATLSSCGRSDVSSYRQTLQLLYNSDRSTCYEVIGQCRYTTVAKGSGEQHTIYDPEIRVIRHGLGYARHSVLFEKKWDTKHTITSSTYLPVWNGKYVPSDEFVLPSARLFASERGIHLVLFDGAKPELLFYNDQTSSWEQTKHMEKMISHLKELWVGSFSPDDIYWDYCLVRHGRFFNVASSLDKTDNVDSTTLYNEWKRASKKP